MIAPLVLAAVPAALRSEFVRGQVFRVGMLLFRRGQPGIVGHLVETGGLADSVVKVAANANPRTAAANLALDAIGHVNTNHKLNKVLEQLGALQSLQLASLALSGVSLGVSIMSYKLLSARLDTIEGRVEALDDKLNVIVKMLDEIMTCSPEM